MADSAKLRAHYWRTRKLRSEREREAATAQIIARWIETDPAGFLADALDGPEELHKHLSRALNR
jgi:hypothetical protein